VSLQKRGAEADTPWLLWNIKDKAWHDTIAFGAMCVTGHTGKPLEILTEKGNQVPFRELLCNTIAGSLIVENEAWKMIQICSAVFITLNINIFTDCSAHSTRLVARSHADFNVPAFGDKW
jgi:hypothetical protein